MTKAEPSVLHSKLVTVIRLHFLLAVAFAISIILFDAGNLITPDVVLQRWTMGTTLFVITILAWYASRSHVQSSSYQKLLLYSIILADIMLATFLIYNERGMASRAVILFAIPIVASGILNSRRALITTAALCAAAYSMSAIRYFTVNFNEGYKIELYGTIGFYSAVFFLLAALLGAVISKQD